MADRNWSLLSGSIILFVTFNAFQAFNYFFHFLMARFLTVAEYGILATLFSILYILAIFSESIQTILAKYSSQENDPGKLKNIFKKSLKRSLVFAVLLGVCYLAVIFVVSPLLKIPFPLLVLNGLIIFYSFLIPIPRGIMQGKKMFVSLGVNMIIEGFLKLLGAFLLVMIGWKVYGAITATIIAGLIAFLYSFITLRSIFSQKEKAAATPDIYRYSKPVFLATLTTLVLYSADIIIARIMFSPDIAGAYAIASMMAKTVFFATQPITKAMFPLTAQSKGKKEKLFMKALILIGICIVVALTLFFFFPNIIIKVFSGKVIVQSSSILFYLGCAVSLLSLGYATLSYKLSIGRVKGYGILVFAIPIELILLVYFSHNLIQFALAFIVASALFLWASVFLIDHETVDRNSRT
ncbi:oligosaccharide flippase family protein [Candidatus Pacearchaeota archaeon]|nr:oligosaccharide flippase family protein [Candidatus Pacearchaeota archaeon]